MRLHSYSIFAAAVAAAATFKWFQVLAVFKKTFANGAEYRSNLNKLIFLHDQSALLYYRWGLSAIMSYTDVRSGPGNVSSKRKCMDVEMDSHGNFSSLFRVGKVENYN